jgi:hypothetical protein
MRLRLPAHSAGLPEAPPGEPQLAPFDIEALRAAYANLPDADSVREQIIDEAERLLSGELRMFGGDFAYVGWPPAWRRHPHTGYEHPRDVHWSQVSDHDLTAGDIKDVWEPSRFSWAYLLVRAYVISGDDRYPEAFWTALADWIADNPWNCGPNWRCAQESSLRAIGVFFANRAFAHHPSSTPERQRLVNRLLHATGRRVAATIHYAASQRNNHLICEASLLSLVAIIYPDWPETPPWGRRGWRHLIRGITDQFYPDGTYAQHSFTYQRFSMQMLCWLNVVRRWRGLSEPSQIVQAIRRSMGLLHAVQDERSGYVPNFGPNDGGLPQSLSICAYRDFRPTLQAASMLVSKRRLYAAGPWDEEALWLVGPNPLDGNAAESRRPPRLVARDGGLLMTRGQDTMALLRTAPGWRHRPGQADDGHVEIWIGGTEVAGDPGTYRYTAAPPWHNGLATSPVHNTVTIDGGDRCRRFGRFLRTAWPASRVLLDTSGQDWQCWIVQFDVPAWHPQGGEHRRLLLRASDTVVVADLASAESPHMPQFTWNLPPDGYLDTMRTGGRLIGRCWALEVAAPGSAFWEETIDGEGPRGWQSPTYGVLHKRRTLTVILPLGAASVALSIFGASPRGVGLDPLYGYARDALRKPRRSAVKALAYGLR